MSDKNHKQDIIDLLSNSSDNDDNVIDIDENNVIHRKKENGTKSTSSTTTTYIANKSSTDCKPKSSLSSFQTLRHSKSQIRKRKLANDEVAVVHPVSQEVCGLQCKDSFSDESGDDDSSLLNYKVSFGNSRKTVKIDDSSKELLAKGIALELNDIRLSSTEINGYRCVLEEDKKVSAQSQPQISSPSATANTAISTNSGINHVNNKNTRSCNKSLSTFTAAMKGATSKKEKVELVIDLTDGSNGDYNDIANGDCSDGALLSSIRKFDSHTDVSCADVMLASLRWLKGFMLSAKATIKTVLSVRA